jgi:hypothetical protein
MVAEHVLEQITAQGVGANSPPNPPITITDCAGNALNILTARAVLGAGSGGAFGGNGAALTGAAAVGIPAGSIDWVNQTFAQVPAGYAAQYVACGAGGKQTTFDVRWDVIQMSTNSRLTVISARPLSSRQDGGLQFVHPVSLRTID